MFLGSLVRRPAPLALALVLSVFVSLSHPAWALRIGEPEPAPSNNTVTGGRFDSESWQAFPKWSGVVERVAAWPVTWTVAASGTLGTACGVAADADCVLTEWSGFLAGLRREAPAAWLQSVNAYINGVRYLTDIGNWGKLDYWAAPDEFFARGGDCEDFAIAKYFSLKMIGFPAEQMRVVVLNDKRLRIAHAVLEVRIDDQTYVLDNRYSNVMSWDEVSHYRAIYSVNEANFWVHIGEQQPTTTWELPATAAGATAE
jgi:predicted transglutaminase-like cysteine proteinase